MIKAFKVTYATFPSGQGAFHGEESANRAKYKAYLTLADLGCGRRAEIWKGLRVRRAPEFDRIAHLLRGASLEHAKNLLEKESEQ